MLEGVTVSSSFLDVVLYADRHIRTHRLMQVKWKGPVWCWVGGPHTDQESCGGEPSREYRGEQGVGWNQNKREQSSRRQVPNARGLLVTQCEIGAPDTAVGDPRSIVLYHCSVPLKSPKVSSIYTHSQH